MGVGVRHDKAFQLYVYKKKVYKSPSKTDVHRRD